jgi:biopolymer transport protein ExbD
MGRKYKAAPVNAEINVTPMADVMLVLLIIFMVITPMLQKGVSVDLVQTDNPRQMADADKEDAVLLAVTRDGRIFLGTNMIQPGEITIKVEEAVSQKLDKTVYVKGDARAKYGDVVRVVDGVRAAGVDHLGLLTERVEREAPGPPDLGTPQASPVGSP